MEMTSTSDVSALAPPVQRTPAYDLYGSQSPISPVVISVPHAARDYPAALLKKARASVETLRRLEDRYADLLVRRLVEEGYSALVARAPRAMIDLNRNEREVDPAMIRGLPHNCGLLTSAKLRGGLGLVPRRLQGVGELWQDRLDWRELTARIEAFHRPYHAAIERLMRNAQARHGHAILLDIHSMPPLQASNGGTPAQVVLGDRFGRSASSRLMALAGDLCAGRGLTAAQNHPYPGNYLIERHGRPEQGLHALQLEIDRSLYLDSALDQPGPGLPAMQALIADMADALSHEMPCADFAQAAE